MRERRRQSLQPSDPEEGDASEVSWAGKRKGGQLAWIDGYTHSSANHSPLHLLLLYIVSVLFVSGTSFCTSCPCCLSLGLPLVHRARVVCLWDFLLYIVSVRSVSGASSCTSCPSCLWDFLLYIVPVLPVSGASSCTSCPSALSLGLPLVHRVRPLCLWGFLLYIVSVRSVSGASSCT